MMKPLSWGWVYTEGACTCGDGKPHGHYNPALALELSAKMLPLPVNQNVYKAGPVSFEAWNDRLVIVEDPFKSGYECDACGQTGKIECSNCKGQGNYATGGSYVLKKCSACDGTGKTICNGCNGKGVLLEIPDAAKRRPTTGVIVSVGPRVSNLRRDDGVLYHDFVGCSFDLTGIGSDGVERSVTIRIIREDDVLVKVHGHMELSRMRKKLTDQAL